VAQGWGDCVSKRQLADHRNTARMACPPRAGIGASRNPPLPARRKWAHNLTCGLRHTTASRAISAGANVKVMQRMLGHATAAMTLDLFGVAEALGKAIDDTAVQLR
jgi:integrase